MKRTSKSARPLFFEDKPLFGLDIGHDEMRVVQFDLHHKVPRLVGYGAIAFDPAAIVNGVVVKPELIAQPAQRLFAKELIGDISTRRVAVSLPANRALTRAVQLPKMNAKDIDEAVQTEASQYMPLQNGNLYLDYTKLRENEDGIEVFIVAIPKEVVDSYLTLTRLMGLEAVLFDTAIGASAHLFARDKRSTIPSVLVDLGTTTTDITVFNGGLVVTGAVPSGGDDITVAIARGLHVTANEAIMLKSKYGIAKGEYQKQITAAVEVPLQLLIKEIRRTIRYYEQRYAEQDPIGQIFTMGGGANMPGLTEYLTEHLRLPAQSFDPATHIDFGHLRSFYNADRMSYVTAAGLASIDPAEVFA